MRLLLLRYRCCSSDISPVPRPRYFWTSARCPPSFDGGWSQEGPSAGEIVHDQFQEDLGVLEVLGREWRGGRSDTELRLPTFTRCIPRRRPPPQPTGLQLCDEEELDMRATSKSCFRRTFSVESTGFTHQVTRVGPLPWRQSAKR